jgi:hypothetical protein
MGTFLLQQNIETAVPSPEGGGTGRGKPATDTPLREEESG